MQEGRGLVGSDIPERSCRRCSECSDEATLQICHCHPSACSPTMFQSRAGSVVSMGTVRDTAPAHTGSADVQTGDDKVDGA